MQRKGGVALGILVTLVAHCQAKEWCSAEQVQGWQAYMLEAHWGSESQLKLDYRKTFKEVYQPMGYCVCEPGVPMEGWLYLTHPATCKEMFEELLGKLDTSEYVWPPPKDIPYEMLEEYTLGGRVQVSNWYFSQQYNQNPKPHEWTRAVVEDFKQRAHSREEFSYGAETHYIYNVLDQYSVEGQMGIVLGSEVPWIEGILLDKGATKLTTVEYNQINSEHPDHNALTPRELATHFLSGSLPEYDFAVSYSSYEHDGLGRYGDPLDPWGDVWDVRRISCFIKPEGYLYLGVPMGPDQVVWNAHRIYGPYRLPLLTGNFELVGAYDDEGWVTDYNKIWSYDAGRLAQPLLVLKNRRSEPCKR